MRTRDFNALNDLLFKYVFGHSERQDITIAFLNAVLGLEGNKAIKSIQFEDRAKEPEMTDGKLSVLDILCVTGDGVQINIEVQIQNYYNMEKRTLYYWAKLYQDTIGKGEDYKQLRRTVTINLLGYNLLPHKEFHNMYGLYNLEHKHRLTDDLEIHFLEMPKVKNKKLSEMGSVDKWMAFFQNRLTDEEMEELAMSEAAINGAWDAIAAFMRDASQRRVYEQREKAIKDYVSNMNGARAEGIEKGIEQGIEKGIEKGIAEKSRQVALKMLQSGYGAQAASEISGLPLTDIYKIAEDNGIK